ncbi:MAG TPA: DUF4260 domain-containing protein [Gemmatimonadales bacterium]|nr:DUF4260 domain-containing protein [Gemmatimonadales bacterium]
MTTGVSGIPRNLLRLEGLCVLGAGLVAYHMMAGQWTLFLILFFVPDLSMLGYLAGPRIGAAAYNAVHTYAAPALVAGAMSFGLLTPHWGLCLIWVSHIGFDRALGYGLKFSSAFHDTHLGKLGPAKLSA